jgi:hypothetical protein
VVINNIFFSALLIAWVFLFFVTFQTIFCKNIAGISDLGLFLSYRGSLSKRMGQNNKKIATDFFLVLVSFCREKNSKNGDILCFKKNDYDTRRTRGYEISSFHLVSGTIRIRYGNVVFVSYTTLVLILLTFLLQMSSPSSRLIKAKCVILFYEKNLGRFFQVLKFWYML